MVKDSTEILELILKIFALVGGVTGALIFIRKEIKAYNARMSKFFAGEWANEGTIGGLLPTHYIDVSIECDGNELKGCFNVRKLSDDHAWHAVSFDGKRVFSKAKCKIIHIRHGQVLDYGTFILKKKSKHKIVWQLMDGVADFFPKHTVLVRS